MAGLPSPRHALHRRLRIPDLRAGDYSPLRPCHRRVLPGICRSRRLPTQRRRPCGLNVTSRIRLLPCADVSSSRWSKHYRDVPVVPLKTSGDQMVRDAVRLLGARQCDLSHQSLRHAPQQYPAIRHKPSRFRPEDRVNSYGRVNCGGMGSCFAGRRALPSLYCFWLVR